ncbi:hypothetical protein D3C76_1568820 [compost metagenome]
MAHVQTEADFSQIDRYRVGVTPNRPSPEQARNHHDYQEREGQIEVILNAGHPEHQQDQRGNRHCSDSPEFGVRQIVAHLVGTVPSNKVGDALDGPDAIGQHIRLQVGRVQRQTNQQ